MLIEVSGGDLDGWNPRVDPQRDDVLVDESSNLDAHLLTDEPLSSPISIPCPRLDVRQRLGIVDEFQPFRAGEHQVMCDNGKKWEHTTLTTGHVMSVAFPKNPLAPMVASVYAKGLYRSKDGGKTWTLRNANPLKLSISEHNRFVVALDASTAKIIYAGFARNGLARSVDGGVTWKRPKGGIEPEAKIMAITADPNIPGVVYAAVWNGGLSVSTDFGKHWKTHNTGLDVKNLLRLSLTPDGSTLYGAVQSAGVFKLKP